MQADRPLIDYDAVCILQPMFAFRPFFHFHPSSKANALSMLLLGTIIGVFLNAVSPNWLITVCLIVVLSFTVYRTALKAQQVAHQLQTPALSPHFFPLIRVSFIWKSIALMFLPLANLPP